jgi:hypothetical protein
MIHHVCVAINTGKVIELFKSHEIFTTLFLLNLGQQLDRSVGSNSDEAKRKKIEMQYPQMHLKCFPQDEFVALRKENWEFRRHDTNTNQIFAFIVPEGRDLPSGFYACEHSGNIIEALHYHFFESIMPEDIAKEQQATFEEKLAGAHLE